MKRKAFIAIVAAAGISGAAWQPEVEGFEPYSEIIPGSQAVIEMMPIPGGKFIMGSPSGEPERNGDEGPQRTVSIDPFWMSKYEITWDQYEAFLSKNNVPVSAEADLTGIQAALDAVTRPSPPYEDPSFNMGRQGGYPAVSMTQYAALTFCKWLSIATGEFYRLPTEAEWEYACRAGSQEAYSFGSDVALLDEYGWHYKNSGGRYHKVGEKKPNAWGLYDMHGNVAEWTLDQYFEDFYSSTPAEVENPWAVPTDLEPRTVRGGSYNDDPGLLRCAARIPSDPDRWKQRDPQIPKSFWWNTDSPFVGFRVVRPAKKMSGEEIKQFWSAVLDE